MLLVKLSRVGRAATVLLVAGCASCAIISIDEYASGRAGAAADAAVDVVVPPAEAGAQLGVPGVILAQGVPHATGRAQQSHLFHAAEAGLWVFFSFDAASAQRLVTRVSRDFVTWTDGAPLALPRTHAADGRDLAVAPLPPRTFHLSFSLRAGSYAHHHARATVASGSLLFGGVRDLGEIAATDEGLVPDGPAVLATADGRVVELSGWVAPASGEPGAGNVVSWLSSENDDGRAEAFNQGFGPSKQITQVNLACNARALVATTEGTLALWESADAEPRPSGIGFARLDGTSWTQAGNASFSAAPFDANDWGVVGVGTDAHVVRWSGAYEHRIYRGDAFSPGAAVPAAEHAEGGGIAIVADGDRPRAFVLDRAGAVLSSTLSDAGWSTWAEVVPAGAARTGLTAFASADGLALAWNEARAGGLAVIGVRLR